MASFEIVEVLVGGKTRPVDVGIFPDGNTASSIIASLKLQHPTKTFQPRPIKDETKDWKAREQNRFDEGVYEPLGVELEEIKNHFAHRSIKEKANVAYTPDENSGRIDKQTSIHINTYINRFFPKMAIAERRKIVWEYCGEKLEDNLKFAITAEEMVEVYTTGPSSCMSETADEWNGLDDHHPVEAYAGGDLQIAYLKDGGCITARAVVWPEKQLMSHGYGDTQKLHQALTEQGYKAASREQWKGAKLSLIYVRYGILCPYLDIGSYVRINGTHLEVCHSSSEGSKYACNTEGFTAD